MKEKRFGPPPDFTNVSAWTPEKEAKQEAIVFESQRQEVQRQLNLPVESKIKEIELMLSLTIDNAKAAQTLKMPLTEMLQKREEDSFHFHRVAAKAYSEHISWYEAEQRLGTAVDQGQILEDKIDMHRNRKPKAKPTPPHPEGMRNSKGVYENHFKARSTAGWRERATARGNAYARWKTVEETVNNEDFDNFDLP